MASRGPSPTSGGGTLFGGTWFFRWTVAVVVWREEPPKGPGNIILEMALGARKIMCLPAHRPHMEPWFFGKTEPLFSVPERRWRGHVAGLRKQHFTRSLSDTLVCMGIPALSGGRPCGPWWVQILSLSSVPSHGPTTSRKLPFSVCLGCFSLTSDSEIPRCPVHQQKTRRTDPT